jgi:hypothetical protein
MFEELLKDNWYLQEVMEKGIEKERRRLRQILVNFMQTHFPEVAPLAKQQVDLIKDPEVLQNLMLRLFAVRAAEEARQILLAEGRGEKKN